MGGKNPHEQKMTLQTRKKSIPTVNAKTRHKCSTAGSGTINFTPVYFPFFQSCACRFNCFEVGYEWANSSWFQQSLGSSSLTPWKCPREKSAFFQPKKAPGDPKRRTKEVLPELVFQWQNPRNFCDSNQASATEERA